MREKESIGRRRFVAGAGLAGAGVLVGLGLAGAAAEGAPAERKKQAPGEGEEIGPGEDLMREHGVLRRVLLVYGECARRIDAGQGFDMSPLRDSARLVRKFVEDYHERQEEDFLFPRFERADKLVPLVRVLKAQHLAGRALTDRIELAASATHPALEQARPRALSLDLKAFIRMYEPHAAREDTVLFPALHEIVSRSEYDALGEEFERRERAAFGEDGFEHAVAQVDAIEKTLGVEDLAQFTPKV
jgi:hemerythrin-like domain-containing protein